MVRQFRLVNEKGQEFSLMDIYNYCFMSEPSGLGYSYNTSYQQVGNSFFEQLKTLQQGKIDGTANFIDYDNFRSFVDYIENSESLKIGYKPPYKNISNKEYFRNINIQTADKTEIDSDGILRCPVTFDCLSLWYEKQKATYSTSAEENEIRWDFKWDSKFVNYNNRTFQYVNNGHVSAPIIVSVKGPVKNPKLTLKVEGKTYQEVTVNVELQEYESFLYSTQENNFYIRKENTDGTLVDLFGQDYIDPKNNNVIKFPKGKSCELIISAENEILNADISVFTFYKVV